MGIRATRIIGGKKYYFDTNYKLKHDADYRAWAKRQTGERARVVKTSDGYLVYTRR